MEKGLQRETYTHKQRVNERMMEEKAEKKAVLQFMKTIASYRTIQFVFLIY